MGLVIAWRSVDQSILIDRCTSWAEVLSAIVSFPNAECRQRSRIRPRDASQSHGLDITQTTIVGATWSGAIK